MIGFRGVKRFMSDLDFFCGVFVFSDEFLKFVKFLVRKIGIGMELVLL